jgi:hypothetical protein
MTESPADLLGVAHELDLDGVVYAVRKPDQLAQGKFQRWLESRARDAIDRAAVDDAVKRAMHTDLNRDIAAGVYGYNGPVGAAAMQTPEGLAKLLTLVATAPGGEPMAPAAAERCVERHMLRLAGMIAAAEADDPKALAAALRELGLPANFLGSSGGSRPSGSSASKTRRSTKAKRKSRR